MSHDHVALHECWMPAPSRGLAFLLGVIGLGVTGIGAWAVWHIPSFSMFGKSSAVACILILGSACTAWAVWCHALLRSKNSVIQLEWRVKDSIPYWRVTTRDESTYDFVLWDRDSRVTYWGVCLTYSSEPVSNRLREWFFPRSVLLLPSQLGRNAYRQLCRRLLENRQEIEKDPIEE